MQIIMMGVFGLMLYVLVAFGANEDFDNVQSEAMSYAGQMAMIHRAAIDMCTAITCGSGVVDATAYLHPEIKAGTLWQKGMFVSEYDSATKLVMTYMRTGYGNITYGTVSAAFADMKSENIPTVGRWDSSQGKLVQVNGYPIAYKMPGAFSSVLPNGSPVIMNQLF